MSTVTTNTSLSLICNNGHQLRRHRPSQAPVISSYRVLRLKHRCRFLSNSNITHGLSLKILSAADSTKNETKLDNIAANGTSGPSPGPSSNWKTWILGALLSLVVPFWRFKWTPFLAFKRKVDTVVENMDSVAEMVEKVAGGVEKIADEIAGSLPENGKLREAVCFVENIAKEVAKDAHKADEFLDKMVEIEDEVEKGMETIIEPEVACIKQENEEKTPQPPSTIEKGGEEEEQVNDSQIPITPTTTTTISSNQEK